MNMMNKNQYFVVKETGVTYIIKDSAALTLYSGSIASGGNLNQTITDGTVNVRKSDNTLISAVSVKAQGTENNIVTDSTVNIRKSDNTLITAVTVKATDTEDQQVADSAVTVNGNAYADVKATDGLDVAVEYENGTPVGTIVGSVVEIPDLITYNSINVLEYTADDSYVPPSNLSYIEVFCISAGGGGASGRIAALATLAPGGGGGGGGALASKKYLASDLDPSANEIVIGLGGVGGAGRQNNTTATNGLAGTNGGDTTFRVAQGSDTVIAIGGNGATTTASTSPGGAVQLVTVHTPGRLGLSNAGLAGAAGGTTGAGANANSALASITYIGGGASGGAKPAAGTQHSGGAGGRGYDYNGVLSAVIAVGAAGGGNGTNGTDNVILQFTRTQGVSAPNTLGIGVPGSGGGSSNVNNTPGGAGGNGGLYGTGGAGGGAGLVGAAPNGSGAGGNGAQGLCVIIEYLF